MTFPKEWLDTCSVPSPVYSYSEPMFRVTASVAVFVENRVAMIGFEGKYGLPMAKVKAGGETIQFAAIRKVKEDTGIVLQKEAIIPVDFRNTPKEYIVSLNAIDIGMACMVDITLDAAKSKIPDNSNVNWYEVDFELKKVKIGMDRYLEDDEYYMDHDVFLKRAIDVVLMIRN